MVKRDLQRNPPPNYPTGTLVTLRIPKKNRNSTQNRRLLCQILGQPTVGRYLLQTEYGTLNNTYPASEVDVVSDTIVFHPRTSASGIKKTITLNYASRQERLGLPLATPGENLPTHHMEPQSTAMIMNRARASPESQSVAILSPIFVVNILINY